MISNQFGSYCAIACFALTILFFLIVIGHGILPMGYVFLAYALTLIPFYLLIARPLLKETKHENSK